MSLLGTLQKLFVTVEYPLVDAEAFSQFYEHAHPSVFRYVYMLHGGPPGDVEDLTAEVFVRAWSQRRRFRGGLDAALGWVLTIARRLVIDQGRRQRHRRTAALDDRLADQGSQSPESHVLLRERERLALDLLGRVDLGPRNILILRYFFGWRVQEIARHLGASENAVSVTIHRTLAALRSHGLRLTVKEGGDAD